MDSFRMHKKKKAKGKRGNRHLPGISKSNVSRNENKTTPASFDQKHYHQRPDIHFHGLISRRSGHGGEGIRKRKGKVSKGDPFRVLSS